MSAWTGLKRARTLWSAATLGRCLFWSGVSALLLALGCGCSGKKEDKKAKAESPSRWELFSPALIGRWQEAKMTKGGGMHQEADGFTLKTGEPMSGIVFASWFTDGLPATDYAITYEARRVGGSDFFGSVTFPVRNEKTFVTFVLGGWGGAQVGISSIDGYDAASNTTGSSQHFIDGQWYRVRVEVRSNEIQVWLDNKVIVRANTAGRSLGLRVGEIKNCVPFGFATYETEGQVRGCVVERLAP